MDAFQAIVLGIVQGLTEFLPISSSGHLRIVPAFFGWEDPGAAFTAVVLIGTTLIVFGLVMLLAEKVSRRERELDSLTVRDGVVIGCAQALALVPGVSRSGATISAGLFLNFDRTAAARYSFLLSVPAVGLSRAFELRHAGEGGLPVGATVVATLLAFVTGYASIAFLLRYLVRHSIGVFVGYRVILGVLVIALAAAGAIS